MSILIDQRTRVIVQGITGQAGAFHAEKMLEYKTQVVGGVTPPTSGVLYSRIFSVWNAPAWPVMPWTITRVV